MSRIVLSTSSSGLDNFTIDHPIELIRLRLFINNIEFIDGQNINNDRLQYLMQEVSQSPIKITSAPANEVERKLARLQQAGFKDVLVTTLSRQLSSSYDVINQVANHFRHKMNITVYDCRTIGSCEAILTLEAQYLLQSGMSMPNIIQRLDELRSSYQMLFTVDDSTNFHQNYSGGDLSGATAFLNSLFAIKPTLQITNDGHVISINKNRNINSACNYMINELGDIIQRVDSFAYMISSGQHELDQHLIDLLKSRTGINSIAIAPASTVSLAKYGPTGVGLCVFYGEIPYAAKLFNLV